ncbi:MAG: bifunctional 2-keto-4-hydroxyglutarate aldolase/2-keto-3-deoxy-6-phosphogluconate aldolase [Gammaproteobacteria bacterium]|jgi:2-dehydro-3-deoxyphosphogluconate aldolase/(4S)-4-hydroxy-2-oxoglutarate aldolase
MNIITKLAKAKVIAVIRADDKQQAKQIAAACSQGGIKAIEITYTTPDATAVLDALAKSFGDEEFLLGAGTVLDDKTALEAIHAGAKYIVSPGFDEATCKLCNQHQIPYIPGCMTVTEILTAHTAGASAIKLFPANILTTGFLKAIKNLLPPMTFVATGGINVDNFTEWLQAGCGAVGIGGKLTAGAKTGDYQSITDMACAFMQKVQEL